MTTAVTTGLERFFYDAYPHQSAFHASRARHRLLGGAAGPGKTYALLMDHMFQCERFNVEDAPQVHTLLLRRTHPKLQDTVITRFYEKIPRELYRDFNQQSGVVTWRNGSTTKFGSMQHEHDVWGYQGQWYKIGYDELTEFTYAQWQNISAWNRCPVSQNCTKDGATNPIGIGAPWVESLFVNHKPCAEMDKRQKSLYEPKDYEYFPATYLENPIYATDPNYIANLDSYQEAISNALKLGIWGVAGGYFEGAWGEAVNKYPAQSVQPSYWHKRWIGGDWGFDHNSAVYWFYMDDDGITRIYRELVINKLSPEQLAERIADLSTDDAGQREKFEFFCFAFDAFAEKDGPNTFGHRIGAVMRKYGMPQPYPSTKNKKGREQILYDKLRARIETRKMFKDAQGVEHRIIEPALQISDACPELIRTIPRAPRDPKNSEEIIEFLGDDPIAGAGYGLYAMFGSAKPIPQEELDKQAAAKIDDPYARHFFAVKRAAEREARNNVAEPVFLSPWEAEE